VLETGPATQPAIGTGAVGPAYDSRQEADPDLWLQRLHSAFEHLRPADGYLPLAEAASSHLSAQWCAGLSARNP